MSFIKTHMEDLKPDLKKQYTIFMSIEKLPEERLNSLVSELKEIGVHTLTPGPIAVPWFPRETTDVDYLGRTLLQVKDEVNKDHLQFTDQEYRKRRN